MLSKRYHLHLVDKTLGAETFVVIPRYCILIYTLIFFHEVFEQWKTQEVQWMQQDIRINSGLYNAYEEAQSEETVQHLWIKIWIIFPRL